MMIATALAPEPSAAGKPAASMEEVLAAERSACGHVDYTAKFAMGCADLVAG